MQQAPSSSPPADQPETRSKQSAARISKAIGIALGVGIVILYFYNRDALLGISPLEWVGVLVGSLYAVTISHELGHLIAGWFVGFELNSLHISPLGLQRKPTGWSVGRNKIVPTLGFIVMLPRSYERIHQRLRIFILGGPLGNFALNFICGIMLSQPLTPVWLRFFSLTAGLSLLLALVNLLPFEEQFVQSDGARLRMIRRQPQQAERWIAMSVLSGALLRGVRPRDWDAAAVERAVAYSDRSQDHINAMLLAYMWAEDREDYDQAQGYLDPLLAEHSYASPYNQAVILTEGAFFYSYQRRNLALARDYWNQLKPIAKYIPHQTLVYTRTTLLAAEGRLDEARERLQEYLLVRKEHPYTWMREGEAKWLARMHSALNVAETPANS
jgi:Zn-dependent protease